MVGEGSDRGEGHIKRGQPYSTQSKSVLSWGLEKCHCGKRQWRIGKASKFSHSSHTQSVAGKLFHHVTCQITTFGLATMLRCRGRRDGERGRHEIPRARGGQGWTAELAELVYSHRLHVLHSCSKQDKQMSGIGGRSVCY